MKRILVIGATSAIATACCRLWAEQGHEFFLVARDAEKLQQTAQDLEARGAKSVNSFTMDVLDTPQHALMLQQCISTHRQIDIALVAHGTLPDQAACEQDAELALQEFSINGSSVISLLSLLAEQFTLQRCGSLAVISSVAGDRGRPSNYLYGSAKAAVSAFCEGLHARLFKIGVHVITIKPGFVDTPMTQGLTLPKVLVVPPEYVAKQIVSAINNKKAVLYTPRFWALIMLIIRSIPNFIFKRLNL
ncbi:MAG: SDR family oxidoreductase [Thiopseudomonas sp.]|nr:SDR family oxidoreductase [Thiopseudomonas sp.]